MILDTHQKRSDLKMLDTHESKNLVTHNEHKIKTLSSKKILGIDAFRNKITNTKNMQSKEIVSFDRPPNTDLNDDISDGEFDIYIKKLYTDQEKHK
jgi:hypothetical protein